MSNVRRTKRHPWTPAKGTPVPAWRSALARLLVLAFTALVLSACVSEQVRRVTTTSADYATREIPQNQLLNVHIAVFNPGYVEPVDPESRVYPRVRDSESIFVPIQLRDTMNKTGYWGPVRVVPEPVDHAELQIQGQIIHSDGETLAVHIAATDATGHRWLNKTYTAHAAQLSYTDSDPARLEPFQGLYNDIANDLIRIRQGMPVSELHKIRNVAYLRFAKDLAPDAFGDYLQEKKGNYTILGMPARNDPNVARIAKIRERDYRLTDTLDQYYAVFTGDMQQPYDTWREASQREARNYSKLRRQSITRMIAGAAAIAAGIYGFGNSTNSIEAAATQVAIIGGAAVLKDGFDKRSEAKIHAEALRELGESLGKDIQPRRVKVEEKTVILSGSAEAQYKEWRELLRNIYRSETGFEPAPNPS